MKRNIIAFCIFCLCTGSLAACNDFDNPAIPDDEAPEVTPAPVPPAIDPSWNLVQMPDEGGQNPRVFVYKDKKYDALFTRTLGWNGGDGVLTTALPAAMSSGRSTTVSTAWWTARPAPGAVAASRATA